MAITVSNIESIDLDPKPNLAGQRFWTTPAVDHGLG